MRVVVTGIGIVTPLGDDFWECVTNGRFKGSKVPKFQSYTDRFIHFASEAKDKAVSDAGLSEDMLKDAGITISSSKGGILQGNLINMPNIIGRCSGPVLNIISACATGLSSIIIGANIIKTGREKIVLSGGTESCLIDIVISGFSKLGVLTKDGICRPYSKNRSGFVLSEGASVVVLEELEHALKRKAKIYGEIAGYASLGDAYHITSLNPNGETIEKAVNICLERTETGPGDIDYINTHGTGTLENDLVETNALKKVFGRKAYNIPMSSTKPVTGHMLGASGALEFVIGLLAMQNSFIPPTANLEEPDPECDLDYTPNIGRRKNINRFLTLSYGFGGHVACVEVQKY